MARARCRLRLCPHNSACEAAPDGLQPSFKSIDSFSANPNPDSCLRLVSTLLAEQDEEWLTAKIQLNMRPLLDAPAQHRRASSDFDTLIRHLTLVKGCESN